MGIVTNYLNEVIKRQIKQHGVVVWYDPQKHYQDIVGQLALGNVPIYRYEGSFFKLRYELEPHLQFDQVAHKGFKVPTLLVYVPLDPMTYHGALAEIESCGVILRPGMQPPEQNTALPTIARQALSAVLSPDRLDEIERRTEVNEYSLADIERIAESSDVSADQLMLIFDVTTPIEVALRLLNETQYDSKITERKAINEICLFLRDEYGADLPDSSVDALRNAFARHILLTDLLVTLGENRPNRLDGIRLPEGHILQENCTRLARLWRDSRQYQENYVRLAQQVEEPIQLHQIRWTLTQLRDIDTFASTEAALQSIVEELLLEQASQELVDIATDRKRHFWSEAVSSENISEVQSRWSLIATTGRLILMADRIDREVHRTTHLDAKTIINLYTQGTQPWCLLDTYHRQMELSWLDFYGTFKPGDNIEKLVIQGRRRYTEVASALAKGFMEAYHDAGFRLEDVLHQSRLFDTQVKPLIGRGKVAYVLVDALRYEMALDLVSNILPQEFNAQLKPIIGSVPTITEIGMAALMPNADRGKIVAHKGKLVYQIDDTILAARPDRVRYLESKVPGTFIDLKLDELRSRRKAVQEKIAQADFILVTSQEIDHLGEKSEQGVARQTMDNMLLYLHQGLRILRENGVRHIIVAADHGHIFIDDISDDMKIDKPGTEVDIHRRAWIGNNGVQDHTYIYEPLSSFGVPSDLDYASPYSFTCFKVPSSLNYFHGGLSPQELIIPSIAITVSTLEPELSGEIIWNIQPGSATIGSVFTITVSGKAKHLITINPPKVRAAVLIGKEIISKTLSASYNLDPATGYIQLRLLENTPMEVEENTIRLLVDKGSHKENTARVVLYDADTDAVLAQSDKMEVTIFF